jgi:hypothetical protein
MVFEKLPALALGHAIQPLHNVRAAEIGFTVGEPGGLTLGAINTTGAEKHRVGRQARHIIRRQIIFSRPRVRSMSVSNHHQYYIGTTCNNRLRFESYEDKAIAGVRCF